MRQCQSQSRSRSRSQDWNLAPKLFNAMAAHELYFISFILAQLLYIFIIFSLHSFRFYCASSLSLSLFLYYLRPLLSPLVPPNFFHFSWPPFCQHPQWRLFAVVAVAFAVRIRFRFVNEMELNEMYNLLYLGDFRSQCAMRKTKPKSHFRFLFLCNIYSNICTKLIHIVHISISICICMFVSLCVSEHKLFALLAFYFSFIYSAFILTCSSSPSFSFSPSSTIALACQFAALAARIELNRHIVLYGGSYCSAELYVYMYVYGSLSIKCIKGLRIAMHVVNEHYNGFIYMRKCIIKLKKVLSKDNVYKYSDIPILLLMAYLHLRTRD